MPALDLLLQGLAVLVHSLTALYVQPSAAWLLTYFAAADSCRLAATPAGCSYLMHTLGAWRQLGLVAAPQQAPRAPAAGSEDSALAGVRAAHAAGTAGTGRVGFEGGVAAAAGQQLQSKGQELARQCCRCFMEQGRSFTAEQLGMFCKGLAQWGMRGTPELGHKLEQVCHILITRPLKATVMLLTYVFACACASVRAKQAPVQNRSEQPNADGVPDTGAFMSVAGCTTTPQQAAQQQTAQHSIQAAPDSYNAVQCTAGAGCGLSRSSNTLLIVRDVDKLVCVVAASDYCSASCWCSLGCWQARRAAIAGVCAGPVAAVEGGSC